MKTKIKVTSGNSFGKDVKIFSTEQEAFECFKSEVINTVSDSNCERINYITDVDDFWNTELNDDRTIAEKEEIEKENFKGEGFYLNGVFVQGEPKTYGHQSAYSDNNNRYVNIEEIEVEDEDNEA
ncbi:MAG: hypothetical protein WCT77_03625 [Bacteroidota bacterium]|jgi:hypothetical protein